MAVDPDDAVILWPSYFDLRVSREHGRRVAKKEAIEAPTAHMLFEAAKSLGLDCILELETAYPRHWYRTEGRVLVEPKYDKKVLIRKIAAKLKTIPRKVE
ncbi:MAG TPA: signal recognition particle subunit SRP19/SEC65 family protein [Thermoplasmata archaeon]